MYQEWFEEYEKIKKQNEENDKKIHELLDKFIENSDEIIKSFQQATEIVCKKNKQK